MNICELGLNEESFPRVYRRTQWRKNTVAEFLRGVPEGRSFFAVRKEQVAKRQRGRAHISGNYLSERTSREAAFVRFSKIND